MAKCPRCGSRAPHLHPAVAFEGEVQPCSDAFHRRVTSQNTPDRIADLERQMGWPPSVSPVSPEKG